LSRCKETHSIGGDVKRQQVSRCGETHSTGGDVKRQQVSWCKETHSIGSDVKRQQVSRCIETHSIGGDVSREMLDCSACLTRTFDRTSQTYKYKGTGQGAHTKRLEVQRSRVLMTICRHSISQQPPWSSPQTM
jgi:hypothetical protein